MIETERVVRSNKPLAGKVRKGERCWILGMAARNGAAQVRFADGVTAIISITVLRQPKQPPRIPNSVALPTHENLPQRTGSSSIPTP